MKTIISIIILLSILLAGTAYATNQIPFGNQVSAVKNYNRATSQIATSGIIGEKGTEILAEQGFKTIIDLRTKAEGTDDEKLAVEAAAMSYVNIPVTGEGINEGQLAAFTQAIENAEIPALVHCASGNRAGAMWAAYRISKGVSPEIAIEEGRAAGMQPEMEQKISATFVD
jgi:uncharacterized protein (TIGR01244 family)